MSLTWPMPFMQVALGYRWPLRSSLPALFCPACPVAPRPRNLEPAVLLLGGQNHGGGNVVLFVEGSFLPLRWAIHGAGASICRLLPSRARQP